MKAGEEFNIRPIAPCEARRIEAGIFNYGSDIRLGDTPFHVMGLERLVEEQPQDYIGKAALEELRTKGVDRKLVGIILDGDELRAEMSEYWPVHKDGKEVGHMTDAVWSPGSSRTSATSGCRSSSRSRAPRSTSSPRTARITGKTAAIPFVDPKKEVPAGALA